MYQKFVSRFKLSNSLKVQSKKFRKNNFENTKIELNSKHIKGV